MSKKSDLIKKLVKTNVGEKPTFGTNPNDPWSAKANIAEETINETALLNRYLKSRGINPEFVNKDQKVAHSKTNQFKTWMNAHINDPIKEEADEKDTVTFDIPLIIRVLELAREDIKTDMDLHRVVERLIDMRDKGVLTMDDYDEIAAIKEEVMGSVPLKHIKEALSELSENIVTRTAKKVWKAINDFDDPSPKYDGNTPRRTALRNKLAANKKPKKVSESKEANYGGDYQASVLAVKAKAEKNPVDIKSLAARMQAAYRKDNQSKSVKPVKESLDPMAACNCTSDGANTPDDTIPAKKKGQKLIQMSKSAKLVKEIHQKKSMKEETYDHEKEDKSVATYGKKPKLQNPETDSITKEQPKAAAILSGGKTLTGEPRDTIEIDPMMKMRKPSPNSQKSV